MSADAAHRIATLTIAATEGAVVLSRAEQSRVCVRRGGEHTEGLRSGAGMTTESLPLRGRQNELVVIEDRLQR